MNFVLCSTCENGEIGGHYSTQYVFDERIFFGYFESNKTRIKMREIRYVKITDKRNFLYGLGATFYRLTSRNTNKDHRTTNVSLTCIVDFSFVK